MLLVEPTMMMRSCPALLLMSRTTKYAQLPPSPKNSMAARNVVKCAAVAGMLMGQLAAETTHLGMACSRAGPTCPR